MIPLYLFTHIDTDYMILKNIEAKMNRNWSENSWESAWEGSGDTRNVTYESYWRFYSLLCQIVYIGDPCLLLYRPIYYK
jgi:hypothetical protein